MPLELKKSQLINITSPVKLNLQGLIGLMRRDVR